ncbi:hypothetical protein ACI1US_02488 [Leucobacter sp. BZR 635]
MATTVVNMDWMFVTAGSIFVLGALLWVAGTVWGRRTQAKNAERYGRR